MEITEKEFLATVSGYAAQICYWTRKVHELEEALKTSRELRNFLDKESVELQKRNTELCQQLASLTNLKDAVTDSSFAKQKIIDSQEKEIDKLQRQLQKKSHGKS